MPRIRPTRFIRCPTSTKTLAIIFNPQFPVETKLQICDCFTSPRKPVTTSLNWSIPAAMAYNGLREDARPRQPRPRGIDPCPTHIAYPHRCRVVSTPVPCSKTASPVPTFLYGAAHEEGRRLDSIRRELGYFKPNFSGNQWAGGPKSEPLPLKPDDGPSHAVQAKGIVVIGATPWVDNYNVPVFSTDIAAVRRIGKRVSGKGGGLPSVQAMALAHVEDVIEVACNLLEPSRVGGDLVQLEVERLAGEEGMAVGKGYYTDFSLEKIIESYLKLDFDHEQK